MVELLMQSTGRRNGCSRGFTLIEVLVSITILAVGILILGGLLTRSVRTAESASASSYQTAVMAAQAARFDAIPFDQLVAGTTCTTVTTLPLSHTQCVTVTNVTPKTRRVSVVVTPTGGAADSVVFERSISGNGNPLDTP
jgi:prepilin-type N-terminal cleavage/methylation domain-containing protein